jgi:YidC/Oxa1 family membrane protein insertase
MRNQLLQPLRTALYIALAILAFLLFQQWEKEHPPAVTTPVAQAATVANATPAVPAATKAPTAAPPASAQGQLVTVTTDILTAQISTVGGEVVTSQLHDYPETVGNTTPFLLMNDDPKTLYVAASGLVGEQGPDQSTQIAHYTASQSHYQLGAGEPTLNVTLTWQSNGVQINKIFTFTRGSYEVHVAYEIHNHATQPWTGRLYTELARTDTPPPTQGGLVNLATYFGAAVSSPAKPFNKITFKSMQSKPLDTVVQGGWAAMIQHYFISAWIPAQTATLHYYSKVTPGGLYVIGMIGEPLTVVPGATVTTGATLYTGPAIADLLEKAAPGLKLTIDYGWFWFISDIIFWMMQKIYEFVGNWGWSIVLVTLVIKLLFYKLSDKSYRSMSKLKKLQPRMEALRERFGNDRQKLTQATLDLYRQEKVNPMSGCLPIIIQIPVFIALYWVLVESVQLRQAPFIFWIHDLSKADPYYVLPILMGASMFLQQRLNPPPPDPMQAKVMMLMPFVFMVLFANFPAGLMLYWFVNNTLSFLQQWHIMHKINKT